VRLDFPLPVGRGIRTSRPVANAFTTSSWWGLSYSKSKLDATRLTTASQAISVRTLES